MSRTEQHGSPLPEPKARFAICVVEDSAQRLLLLKRAADRPLGPGTWGFPAGHIESGETPRQCAFRELAEETGAAITVEELRMLGPVRDSLYGGIYEIHLFHLRFLGGDIVLNHEHTDFVWADAETCRTLDTMPGIEEDIALLDIWPRASLEQSRLPVHLRLP